MAFAVSRQGQGMKVVELYGRVRYAVQIEGLSPGDRQQWHGPMTHRWYQTGAGNFAKALHQVFILCNNEQFNRSARSIRDGRQDLRDLYKRHHDEARS